MTVGLDIGSSAVRAAEIEVTRDGRRRLRRFAQVGLPAGFVVDGELHNVPGVSEALRRLWQEGGFTSREVVCSVSGPRVFVRQADTPVLNETDLRSSLKFDAQELVPIPMDDATFGFSVLDKAAKPGGEGPSTQRILLVAAHRDMLSAHIDALKGAGLNATVMDPAPLALLRAVPPAESSDGGGTEVLVSIGAELTIVAVRQNGVPRFIRSLTLGGAKLTESIANSLHIEMAAAERLKRGGLAEAGPALTQARKAMTPEKRDLAEEIRATIDFFMSQSSQESIDRLLITGGAAQTEGLAHAIAGNLDAPVMVIDPLAGLDISELDLDDQQLARVSACATTAVGLALWPTDAPIIRLSLLPEEVEEARKARRLMTLLATGVASFLGLLVVIGSAEMVAVHQARSRVASANAQLAALQREQATLQHRTAVHQQVAAQASLVRQALSGDVDWVRVLGQLTTQMPAQLYLQSFNGTHSVGTSSSAASQAAQTAPTISVAVRGTGGLPSVSQWLGGLSADPDLTSVWVTGVSVTNNGGPVQFSSSAILSPIANSNRDREVNP